MARLPGTVEEMLSLAVVTGVALLIGFRPNPSMPTGLRWFADYQPFTPSSRPCGGC